ncbi:uncharacterized protein DEA37_0008965 [Paragonimus westermani]|uniref:Uncharacterized protein n=1 Tax=Paragonimus westermani TaxID=34504 RepID=A0A5J4NM33_9TREM|nr:uncharacterized protein DEA37_0008965 [Paragonimus westermani]
MFGLRKERSMRFVTSFRLILAVIISDESSISGNSDESMPELESLYYTPDQPRMNSDHANIQYPEISQELWSRPDLSQEELYNIAWNNFLQQYNQLSPENEIGEVFVPDSYHLFARPPLTQHLVKKIPEASIWANPVVAGDPNDLRKLRSYPNIFQIDRTISTLSRGKGGHSDKSTTIPERDYRNTHFPEGYGLPRRRGSVLRGLTHSYIQPEDLNLLNNDLSAKVNREDIFIRRDENDERVNRKLEQLRTLASLLTKASLFGAKAFQQYFISLQTMVDKWNDES